MFSKLLLSAVLLLSFNFSNVESVDSVANNDGAVAIGSFVLGQITGFAFYMDYHDSHRTYGFTRPRPYYHRASTSTLVSLAIILTSALSGHFVPVAAVLFGIPVGATVALKA